MRARRRPRRDARAEAPDYADDGRPDLTKPQPIAREPGAFPSPWSFDGALDPMAEEFAAQWRRLLADVRGTK